MINIDDLHLVQVKFEVIRNDYEKEFKDLEKLRKEYFQKKYLMMNE